MFEDGKIKGEGILTLNDGTIYEGNFNNEKMNG